jgi:polyhydroxyalkanoate synthesis regulator phasin
MSATRPIPPELHERLGEVLGEDAAELLMERLMPVPWDELAKDRDLVAVRADVAALRVDVDDLRTDVNALKTDVAGLKTDVAELKTDLRELRTELAHGLETTMLKVDAFVRERTDAQTRQIVVMLVGAVVLAAVANVLGIGR